MAQPSFGRDIWIGLGISLCMGLASIGLLFGINRAEGSIILGIGQLFLVAHLGLVIYALVARRYGLLVGWALCHVISVMLFFVICGPMLRNWGH
jgi:hypothetical protein